MYTMYAWYELILIDATVSDAEGRLKTYCKLSMFKFKKIENKALSQIHFSTYFDEPLLFYTWMSSSSKPL